MPRLFARRYVSSGSLYESRVFAARKYLNMDAFVCRWRSARARGNAGGDSAWAGPGGKGAVSAMGRAVSRSAGGESRTPAPSLLKSICHGRRVRKSDLRDVAGRCARGGDLGVFHAIRGGKVAQGAELHEPHGRGSGDRCGRTRPRDRKSTRLNSSHLGISYAVFCLKKK